MQNVMVVVAWRAFSLRLCHSLNNCLNNRILIFFTQIRVHRQADHLLGDALGNRKAALRFIQVRKYRLQVERYRVVHRCRYSLILQFLLYCVAVIHQNGVLSVDAQVVLFNKRRLDSFADSRVE
jgi:hypothetical protein